MAIFTPEGSPHILIATAPRVDEGQWSDWQDRLTLGKSIRHRLPKLWDATFGMQEATRGLSSRTLPESALGANGFTYRDRFVIPAMDVDLDGIEILGAIMCANKRARGFRLLLFASPDTYSHWGRNFAIGMIELPLPDEWDRPDTYFLSSKDKDIAAQLVDYSFSKASYGERSEQIHDLTRLYDLRFASRADELESIGTDTKGNRHILVGGATAGRMRDDSLRPGAKFDEEGVGPTLTPGGSAEKPVEDMGDADDFEDYVPGSPEEKKAEEAVDTTPEASDATPQVAIDRDGHPEEDDKGGAESDEPRNDDDIDDAIDTDDFEDYSPEVPSRKAIAAPEAAHRAYEAIFAWDEEFEDYEAPGQDGGQNPVGPSEADISEGDADDEDTDGFGDWEPAATPNGDGRRFVADRDEVSRAMGAISDLADGNGFPEPNGHEDASASSPAVDGNEAGDAEPVDEEDTAEPLTQAEPPQADGPELPAQDSAMLARDDEDDEDDIVDYIGEWEDEADEVFAPRRHDAPPQRVGDTMATRPPQVRVPPAPRPDPRPTGPDAPTPRPSQGMGADEWLRAVRQHIAELCGASDTHLSAFGRSLLGQAIMPNAVIPVKAKATAAMAETLRRMGAPAMTDEQIRSVLSMTRGTAAPLPAGQSKDMPVMVAALAAAIAGDVVRIVVPSNERAASDSKTASVVMARCAGIRVGHVTGRMTGHDRDTAYGCPVVYGTAEVLAFDWLRDNMSATVAPKLRYPSLILSSDLEGTLLGAIGRHVSVDGVPDGRGSGKAAIDCSSWLLSAGRLGGTLRADSPYVRELFREYPDIDWREVSMGTGGGQDLPGFPSHLAAAAARIADAQWSEVLGTACRTAYEDRRPFASLSDIAGVSAFVRSLIATEARKVATDLAADGGDGNAHAALVWYAEVGGGQDAVEFRKAILHRRGEDAYVALCGMLATDFEEAMAKCGGEVAFTELVKTIALRKFDAMWAAAIAVSERRTAARQPGSSDTPELRMYEQEMRETYARGIDRMPHDVLSGVLHACDGMRV